VNWSAWTLLHCAAGLEQVTSDQVVVAGRVVDRLALVAAGDPRTPAARRLEAGRR
jgi:hypothetical protein